MAAIKIFGRELRSSDPVDKDVIIDVKRGNRSIATLKRGVKQITLVYNGSEGRNLDFRPSPFDLSEIANMIAIESLARRAVDKYVEQIWKRGYEFVGSNPDAIRYLKMRFNQIANATGIPTSELFRSIAEQLVSYSNCFIIKIRNAAASGGRPRRLLNGKLVQPVAGYDVADATTMLISQDESGNVNGYKQVMGGRYRIWKPENVIHITYSRQAGLTFGTPMLVPVMDDIRALRKMEEMAELVSFRYAVPLFHVAVGTDANPGTQQDVNDIGNSFPRMAVDGALKTDGRVTVNAVGAQGRAIQLEGYLRYFRQRVLSGLGLSEVTAGGADTSNRATALVLSKEFQDTTHSFQMTLKTAITEFMIKELMAEGGYVWDAYNERDKVELYFPEIDLDNKISRETHAIDLYTKNGITEDEMRKELGLPPLSDSDRKKTYWELIGKPKALIQAIDEKWVKPAAPAPRPQPRESAARPSPNRNTNQHVSNAPKLSKVRTKDDITDSAVSMCIDGAKAGWLSARREITAFLRENWKPMYPSVSDEFSSSVQRIVRSTIEPSTKVVVGYSMVASDGHDIEEMAVLEAKVEGELSSLARDVVDRVNLLATRSADVDEVIDSVAAVFDFAEERLKEIVRGIVAGNRESAKGGGQN